MKLVIYCVVLAISFFFNAGYVIAQERSLVQEQQRINNFFTDSLSWEHVKDTTQLLGFAFNAVVERDTTGVVHLVSLTANDTIAYKLYPGYEILKGINYGLFMGDRKKAIFIYPVLLQTYSSQNKESVTLTSELVDAVSKLFTESNDVSNMANCIYFRPCMLFLKKIQGH